MADNIKIEYLLDGTAVFNDAFRILNKELNKRIKNADNGGDKSGVKIMIPSIVMLSFTIELGIKTILYKKDNKLVRGHRFEQLFKELDQHRRNRIRRYTCTQLKIDESSFDDLLEKNGSAFVDWRYFFEKSNSVDYSFLSHFNDSLQRELQIENDNLSTDLY